MMYDICVSIVNSPTKVRKLGYLIEADTKDEAKEKALSYARKKASKPYSRYKKCSFEIKEKDVIERPDW